MSAAQEFWRAIGDGDVDAAYALAAVDAEINIRPAGILGTASREGREFFTPRSPRSRTCWSRSRSP